MANEYRVSKLAVAVLHSGAATTNLRVSKVGVNVLHSGGANTPLRVSKLSVNVLRSIAGTPTIPPTSSRNRQLLLG